MVSIKIKGAEQLINKLKQYQKTAPGFIGKALYVEAETIMTDSKENYVPVDTGTLRESGLVEKPQVSSGKVTVKLGFGGAAQDYALIVHERQNAKHPVGQWKYLEAPMLKAADGMGVRLADSIKEMF